ncbi:MAG: hypothetical protein N3B10_04090, partial [Armatimonadetes bacterium]|nr:hypothetical protein [Armatimonadota bacterium]
LVPSLIQHHRSMWLFYLKNYRKRYPLILFPLIGLGILMRLGGGLLRVCVHRLRVCCHEKLSALLGRQSTLTISEDEPSENQTLRA